MLLFPLGVRAGLRSSSLIGQGRVRHKVSLARNLQLLKYCVLRILPITKQVGPRLGFDGFDINTRDKVSKERNILFHIRPNFMDQEGHFDHQVRIGRIGNVRFLDS